jgi:periplasmic protein TonB
VPTPDTPAAEPQPASTAVAIEPPAAVPLALTTPSLPTPSAQRVAELARLRESAARREPLTLRTAAARTAPATIERSVEPKAPVASLSTVAPATTELPGTPAVAAVPPAPVHMAALQPLDQPRPQFPAEAVREGIDQGRVVARLHVGDDGRVGKVDIVESIPRRAFDRAVLGAAAQWRYAPPGQPRSVVVEFVFRRDS